MAQQQRRISVDPVLAVGTGLSLAMAVGFYFYSDLALTIATFAGLLGMIITLQIQESTKERRRAEHESRLGSIIATMERSSWLPDVVGPMVRSATNVRRSYPDTPAVEACQRLMEECRAQLADLEGGRFQVPYTDNTLALRLSETMRSELLAISVPALDLRWWLTPEGRRYWAYQQQALRRGATIRRVFIHDGWSGEVEAMAREQQDAGVDVRRVHRNTLPVGARGIVGIWERSCGVEVKYDAAGEAVTFAFTVAGNDRDRLRRQFELVERMASTLDEPEPTAGVTGSAQLQ